LLRTILENPRILIKKLFLTVANKPFICTSYQQEFIRDIILKKHDKYLFVASTRAGKSEITSIAAILLALLYDGEQIQVISPTWNQSQIVFKKIRNHCFDSEEVHLQIDMRNEFSNQEINFKNGSKIHCLSVGGARKGAQVLGFGGTVIIIDESEEVEDDIYKTKILRMLASAERQAILIELGTPHKANHFKESFQSGAFKIYQVPYTKAVEEGIMNEKEVQYIRAELTEIEFKVWYCAEFPDEDEDSLFTLEELQAARENDKQVTGRRVLGVDVARFGSDKTVFTYVEIDDGHNVEIKDIWFTEKKDTMQTVGKIKELHALIDFDKINIDVIGLGSGVYDRLYEDEFPVFAAHFGQSPSKEYTQTDFIGRRKDYGKKQRAFNYQNKKAEQFFRLKKMFETNKISITTDKKDCINKLFSDLSKMKWELTSNAKIKISDWERLSPDFADSLVYAVWEEQGQFYMEFADT